MPDAVPSPDTRDIDVVAVSASLRRRSRAAEPPFLHAEVARRMAERLQIIKLQPTTLVEWGGFLGASDALLAAA